MTDLTRSSDGDRTRLDRRSYLTAAGTAGLLGLAGCLGGGAGDGATGMLATQVTDQPGDIADFESCVVTIRGIWTRMAEDGTDDATATSTATPDAEDGGSDVDESDGRTYHEFDEAQEADLVQLQDGNTKLVGETELAAGDYSLLQLDVTGVEGVLDGGGEATVDTPGNAPLQFDTAYEVRADERTVFTADFTPVRRGRTDEYLLQPVATGTTVEYES